jgi:hypothetical protein
MADLTGGFGGGQERATFSWPANQEGERVSTEMNRQQNGEQMGRGENSDEWQREMKKPHLLAKNQLIRGTNVEQSS